MNNKKSLLQDSLQELENIKNESLELAKEQLINESADLLEKKSAALFEKLIAGEEDEEEEKEEEDDEKKSSKKEKEKTDKKKSRKDESSYINEMLNELKDLDSDDEDGMSDDDIEDSDDEDGMSDEDIEDSDDEEMSLDDLRKAAEEQGFKLVADTDDEEDEEEVDDTDDEEDEEEVDDTDDEEDIEFNDDESDEDEFSDVNVDNKVLAEPSDEEEDEDDEESLEKINENFKRKNTKMRNTKKQVLKDLRDVSFNKLVEAYYNMGETDSFIIKENEYIEEDSYDEGMNPMDEELYDEDYNEGFHSLMDEDLFEDENYEEGYSMKEYGNPIMDDPMMDETLYEIEMPEMSGYNQPKYDENYELTEEELNEMLEGMDIKDNRMMKRSERASGYKELDEEMFSFFDNDPSMNYNPENEPYKPREFEYPDTKDVLGRRGIGQIGKNPEEFKQMKKDPSLSKYYPVGGPKGPLPESNELEKMFETMTLEELHEMESLLHEEGDGMESSTQDGQGGSGMKFKVDPMEDYEEKDLTESQIEEMLAEMGGEEEIEESMSLRHSQPNKHQAPSPRNREERIRPLAEEEMEGGEDFKNLQEQVKKLKQENKALNEGFTNKVKSLENKVYDVTISALKAGFVNKFLLEHPLRENEKLQIIHRFTNAQTKEQIKETYISLTNEFAKGQTVKDGSMLNESVQNKVGKVHRTDNAIVTEKNLMNESDESNRFKQLLNYNFGKRK
jgi:hypothetical protein